MLMEEFKQSNEEDTARSLDKIRSMLLGRTSSGLDLVQAVHDVLLRTSSFPC